MADRVKGFEFPGYSMRRSPKLTAAAEAIRKKYEVPDELALASALGAASAACQGCIDIEMPYGGRIPAALAVLVVAESGERKTASLSEAMKELEEFDGDLEKIFRNRNVEYKAKLSAWKSKRKKLEKEISARQDAGESCDDAVWALEEHMKREPVAPRPMRLLYKDVSPSVMLESMKEWGVAALVSSEGGEILDGKMFEAIPNLNSAWSGAEINLFRARGPMVAIPYPRLTTCIMSQKTVLDWQPRKKDKMLKDSGHWARYIVFWPESTMGSRFSVSGCTDTASLEAFHARMRSILDDLRSAVENNDRSRKLIKFSNAAADYWSRLHLRIEAQLGTGGVYHRAQAHGAKLAENVARVAGIIHYFEGFEGDISKDTVELADTICTGASEDYMSLFVPPPEEQQYAEMLWDYLQRWTQQNIWDIPKNHVLQYGPKSLRRARELNMALSVLIENNCVMVVPGANGAQWIRVVPMYTQPSLPG